MSAVRSPLKPFVLTAMFWLPAMFFLWFVLNSPVAYPVIRAAAVVLESWLPELIRDVHQEYHYLVFSYEVRLSAGGLRDAALLIEEQRVNVLIYAYGLPLFMGLVMATPLSWARTFAQFLLGALVLVATETFGVVGNVLVTIALGAEPAVVAGLADQGFADAAAAGASAGAYVSERLAAHGLGPDLIALIYQFGYLVVPAVGPVVLWIAFNRRFLETLVGWRTEPDEPAAATDHPRPLPEAGAEPVPEPERAVSGPMPAPRDHGGLR